MRISDCNVSFWRTRSASNPFNREFSLRRRSISAVSFLAAEENPAFAAFNFLLLAIDDSTAALLLLSAFKLRCVTASSSTRSTIRLDILAELSKGSRCAASHSERGAVSRLSSKPSFLFPTSLGDDSLLPFTIGRLRFHSMTSRLYQPTALAPNDTWRGNCSLKIKS